MYPRMVCEIQRGGQAGKIVLNAESAGLMFFHSPAILSLYKFNPYGMIESQGKGINNVPKAEPRSLLPCSTDVMRGSAFGLSQEPPVEILLDQFAEILVAAYFHEKRDKQ